MELLCHQNLVRVKSGNLSLQLLSVSGFLILCHCVEFGKLIFDLRILGGVELIECNFQVTQACLAIIVQEIVNCNI